MRERDPDALLALQGVNHAAAVKFDEYLQRLARYIINELNRSMKG
jgi:hypothetical protein